MGRQQLGAVLLGCSALLCVRQFTAHGAWAAGGGDAPPPIAPLPAPPAPLPQGDSNESNATTESEEDREARIRRENLARALAAAKESLASQGLLGEFESSC